MLDTIVTVKDALGKLGKKVGEAAKKTEDLAGNVWQHCEYYYLFFRVFLVFFPLPCLMYLIVQLSL